MNEGEQIKVEGKQYWLEDSTSWVSDDCPEGFSHSGSITKGKYKGDAYYTNPECPEQIWVYTETYGFAQISLNEKNNTEMFMRYVKFVK